MVNRFELFVSSISCINRCIQKIQRDEMVRYGLKGPHAQYLIAMNRFPEGITAAQLSNICEKDKAAVSRAVSEREKGGLICRANKASTSYRAMLTLTERGKEATAQLIHKAELAVAMLLSGCRCNEFVNNIINVAESQKNIRIVHLDGKPVGYVVAECRHCAIVVGAAPFAEEIGKAVYQYLCACFSRIVKHQLLSGTFALTVRIVKFCLNG